MLYNNSIENIKGVVNMGNLLVGFIIISVVSQIFRIIKHIFNPYNEIIIVIPLFVLICYIIGFIINKIA